MIATAAAALDTLPFESLGGDTLLDRVDTKYLIIASEVPSLLREILHDYRVVTYGLHAISRYQTVYFDTADFRFYQDHRTGRAPRVKVRIRSYLDSDLSFLEVKWKTHRGRTFKVREKYLGEWSTAVEAFRTGPHAIHARQIPWELLRPTTTIDYDRLTVMRRCGSERVTLDLNFTCKSFTGESITHPGMAIVEVKQARISRTGVTEHLRRRQLRDIAISKYCFAVAELYPRLVKTHEYRHLLAAVSRVDHGGSLHPLTALSPQ